MITPSFHAILDAAAEEYGVAPIDIQSYRRDRSSLDARHAAMFLGRKLTPLSLQQIGSMTGNRDHATVMNAIRRVDASFQEIDGGSFAPRLAAITARLQKPRIAA